MAYSEAKKKATQRYITSGQRQIIIRYRNADYSEIIEPGVKASGLPAATFYKKAIADRIDVEKMLEPLLIEFDSYENRAEFVSKFIKDAVSAKIESENNNNN